MRTFEKDYEYLLLSLIPRHRLQLQRRKQVERAIRAGEPEAIRRVAVLALEDLCRAGYYCRRGAAVSGERVSLTYVRNNGRYQIRLRIPADEWEGTGPAREGGLERPVEPAVEGPRAAGPTTAGRAVETTFEILPEIIRSFSINSRRESTFERLESIMRMLPGWLRISAGRLVLVEERLAERRNSGAGNLVVTRPERTILEGAIYERCRRSGEMELLGLEAARALGIPERPEETAGAAGGGAAGGGAADGEATQVAVAPIYSLGEFWGILEMWIPQGDDEGAVGTRVRIAAGMIEQIVENAVRLENLTSVDKLTGIYNRHFYDAQVRIEIERATRSGSKLSMLVVDIDDFKRINDTMGHRKGDQALSLVADLIKKNLRKIDLPFRYGGEEFVILLPGTAEVEAIHTAERLRDVIGGSEAFTDERGEPRRIHVSIGAAVFPDHARSEQELFSRADAALYRAKREGKNRVEFYRGA